LDAIAAATDIGERGLDDAVLADAHLVDRRIAEIANFDDLAGRAVFQRRLRRLAADADLFRPHRHPHARTWSCVRLNGGVQASSRRAVDAATILAELAFEQIHLADEIGNPARLRLFIDFRRRPDLNQPAMIHDADTVGNR